MHREANWQRAAGIAAGVTMAPGRSNQEVEVKDPEYIESCGDKLGKVCPAQFQVPYRVQFQFKLWRNEFELVQNSLK